MKLLDIFIQHQMQSGNAFTSGYGAKWAKKAYREKWGNMIRSYCHVVGPYHAVGANPGPLKVYAVYVRYMAKRERELDSDNVRDGFKLIQDNLKPVIKPAYNGTKKKSPRVLGLGYIYDDRPEWFESKILQIKRPDRPGVGIFLTTDEAEYKQRIKEPK